MPIANELGSVPVKQIMTKSVDVLSPGDTIKDAIRLMGEGQLSTVPVVDVHGKCIGILGRSDFTEQLALEDDELSQILDSDRISLEFVNKSLETSDITLVKELMTHEVTTISDDVSVTEACRKMAELHVHHLPVVDGNGGLVGIVSAFDVVRAVAQND